MHLFQFLELDANDELHSRLTQQLLNHESSDLRITIILISHTNFFPTVHSVACGFVAPIVLLFCLIVRGIL